MSYQNTFNQFMPKLLQLQQLQCAGFLEDLALSNLLVCGEVHGVRENCDVLYSLCMHYGFNTLALEPSSAEIGAFLDSASTLHPNFRLIDKRIFVGSPLSVEMAKTVALMINSGVIGRIEYLTDADFKENDREHVLAQGILRLPKNVRTICLLGNWHTTPKPMITGEGIHISALRRARKAVRATYIEYRYLSGALYNYGTGIDSFEESREPREYRLKSTSHLDYEITIPRAHHIYFEEDVKTPEKNAA